MMSVKIRKQIYIEPRQEAILKRLARETGLSEAEFIRQTIDRQAQILRLAKHNPAAWERERAFIRDLIQQGVVSGSRTWRREELHKR
jgi:hypothetical protein